MNFRIKRWLLSCSVLVLAGCAGVSMDAQRATVSELSEGRTGDVAVKPANLAPPAGSETNKLVAVLLASPLSVNAAVELALLNSEQSMDMMAQSGVQLRDSTLLLMIMNWMMVQETSRRSPLTRRLFLRTFSLEM